jgi:hypothetical protein
MPSEDARVFATRKQMRLKLTTVILVAAMVPMALAQGGQRGEGGPPQGGMRRGGPGMMQGPAILFRPDVQKELKLTEAQVTKLREVVPGPGGPGGFERGQGGQGHRGQGGPPQGQRGPGSNPEEMQKLDAAVKGVLNDTQYKRYHELDLQLAGAMAILRPDVSEKLKLTEEQTAKVREVARPQGGPGFGGPPQGQRGQRPDPEQFEKMRKEQDEKILAVLTDKQLVQWHQMLGKKFAFEKIGPPPVGR